VTTTGKALLKPGITLYIVRHGETDWNREMRYQGQRDIAMNDMGRQQARRNGQILAGIRDKIEGADFVSSGLVRAIETMQLMRTELGLSAEDFKRDPAINELSYGAWEGVLAREIPRLDPLGHEAKSGDPFTFRPSGGESYRDLKVRVAAWISTLERDTVAVSHGGVSRVARAAVFNLPDAQVPFLPMPQDKILILTSDGETWM
jgi:broad specificity phosphatase PhoE